MIVATVHHDVAVVRSVEPHDHPHRGRFSSTVRTQKARDHTGAYREAQLVDGELVAVALGQLLCLDHRDLHP